MAVGLIFAGLVLAAGLLVARCCRLPVAMAPVLGLGATTVLATWSFGMGLPPAVATGGLVVLAACGCATNGALWTHARLFGLRKVARWPRTPLLLAATTLAPLLLLGVAFVGVEAPLSTHDGAFHVEVIDALRRGGPFETWYPLGFHRLAAATLGLAPWLDSARGTAELGLGLAALAPLTAFGLARAWCSARSTALAAAGSVALTWLYPYDYHLWGGWPQGMGVLLALGTWMLALDWLRRPSFGAAAGFGLLGGAIVITHGIDLYTAAIGLAVIAALSWRELRRRQLVPHLAVAGTGGVLAGAAYLPTLLGWARAGGASGTAEASGTWGAPLVSDWLLQAVNGATGAAGTLDLPLRLALLIVGIASAWHGQRALVLVWAIFVALPIVAELSDAPPVRWAYAVTFPWLADQRPREISALLASVLGGIGLVHCWAAVRAVALSGAGARRLAVGFVLLVGFFAEGSGVSIEKRLMASVAAQESFSADDGAAMSWLRRYAEPGTVLVNDRTVDAGIWAPYKADVPILLPRSASTDRMRSGEVILDHVLDLQDNPRARDQLCSSRAEYVYYGAKPLPFEDRGLPDRQALERAPYLTEVFSSGNAAVFRIDVACP